MRAVWIVEMLDRGKWTPTVGCGLIKKEAENLMRWVWEKHNRDDKFRVKRYQAKD